MVVIPRSSGPDHMEQNLNIFSFALTPRDVYRISHLDGTVQMPASPVPFDAAVFVRNTSQHMQPAEVPPVGRAPALPGNSSRLHARNANSSQDQTSTTDANNPNDSTAAATQPAPAAQAVEGADAVHEAPPTAAVPLLPAMASNANAAVGVAQDAQHSMVAMPPDASAGSSQNGSHRTGAPFIVVQRVDDALESPAANQTTIMKLQRQNMPPANAHVVD